MRFIGYVFISVFVFIIFFMVTEIGLRIFNPKQYIVPASDFTPEYGAIAYPEQKIINAKPNHFHLVYTTNELRYRGKLIPFNSSTRKIILLGDSNIFGFGVFLISFLMWVGMGLSRVRIPATMESNRPKQLNSILSMATGLIIGAIAARGLVKVVLHLKYSQAEGKSRNVFEWPELKSTNTGVK